MKMFLIFLVLVGAGYGLYSNYLSRKTQNELLRKEVAALESQNEKLSEMAQQKQDNPSSDPAKIKRVQDLQTRLSIETKKLTDLKARKDLLSGAVNDPARASSLNEFSQEIKEKNEAIQSLQLQLSANQDDEKQVDHGGEQAKQYQNLNKAQAIADLNDRIRNQQELIKSTEGKIHDLKILGTADSMDEAGRQVQYLAQEKGDLQALRSAKDQVNVAVASNTTQIHEEVGYEKSNIHSSEQQIRAQIAQLRTEVKSLESQNSGQKSSLTQVKSQMTYVDQQISIENDAIARIKDLIKAENQ